MKFCWILLYLTSATAAFAQQEPAAVAASKPQIVHLTLDSSSVTLLRLKPGYVTSIRVPDEVSSVVIGDPGCFKAEHSESEPRFVFIKPTTSTAAETNAFIITKSGRGISLDLVNPGTADQSGVDFVLDYSRPRDFFINDSRPSVLIAETHNLPASVPQGPRIASALEARMAGLLNDQPEEARRWQGKQLRVALNKISDVQQEMIVSFSVMNISSKTIELLPPQIQLAGASDAKRKKSTTAAQVPVNEYKIVTRRLPPHTYTNIAVAFERPSFKQANQQLLLQIADAEEVDHPVFVPLPFVAPAEEVVQ